MRFFTTPGTLPPKFIAIIRFDLLKRLLHPSVYQHYLVDAPVYLDPQNLSTLPVEFAQAYRFGHAMIRPIYFVNDDNPDGEHVLDMMLATSAHRPWRMPLDESWLIQWSRFFRLGDAPANLSRRIVPAMSEGLVSAKLFSAFDESGKAGLIYRDLISSLLLPAWSVRALVSEIKLRQPNIARLIDLTGCEIALASWLAAHRGATHLTDEDCEEIVRDPPLLVFVLIEAAHSMDGTQLGPLGSVLLAEVLQKALDSESPSGNYSLELLSFLSISRMDASLTNARALRVRFSKSFANRRHRLSQANVRSTTQRLGKTLNPATPSERLTISTASSGSSLASSVRNFGPW